jgi:hypothetical protein
MNETVYTDNLTENNILNNENTKQNESTSEAVESASKAVESASKAIESTSKAIEIIRIFVGIMLFVLSFYLMKQLSDSSAIAGLVSQTQVIISIYLVVTGKTKGYIISIFANLFAISFAVKTIMTGNMDAVPGVFVPITTLISITIIYVYGRVLNKRILLYSKQTREITQLYKELIRK